MREVKIIGQYEQGSLDQANNCLKDAEYFLLMADNHKGYGMPVGGVAVYRDKISPAGVGFDIACGNKAVKTSLKLEDIKDKLPELADRIFKELSFGVGLNNGTVVEDELFQDSTWELDFFKENVGLKQKARNQLGTIGSGNHYVDVFADEEDNIWVGVHFGSRGLGHTVASHFMRLAGDNTNIMDETPHLLDVNTKDGQEYIASMRLAGKYAYAGRDWVCKTVVGILGGEILDEIHNHHNFAWEEEHSGEKYWVVRKGATPAFPNQRGFIGSSMGDNAVIVEGIDSDKSKELFYSTVHGAGRVMSRTQATGKSKRAKVWKCGNYRNCDGSIPYFDLKPNETKPLCPKCQSKMNKSVEFTQISEGLVDFEQVKKMMVERGIELRGAGADEAPQVYKDLKEVLSYHEGTINILHTLRPLIVCMAGKDEFDPYKD